MQKARRSISLLAVVLPALASDWAAAQEEAQAQRPEARISVGVGKTDNLNRDAIGLDSDVETLGVGFAARRDRSVLQAAVAGDLEFLHYGAEQITDDHEVLGSVDGLLSMRVVPDRFRWDMRLGSGQVRTDSRAVVSRNNRQRVTVTSTGPEVSLPFGGRNEFQFGALVAERRFDATEELDSQLTTLRLAVARAVNPVAHVSLNFEQSDNKFDINPDPYKFKIVSVEYRKDLVSGQAAVRLGRGDLQIGDNTEPTTVARLAWNRAVGARSRLEVSAGRELTDAGGLFAGAGAAAGEVNLSAIADVAITTDGRLRGIVLSRSPLRRDSASMRFDMTAQAAGFGVYFAKAQDRFENDATYDNKSTTLQLSGSLELGQRWHGDAFIARWEQDFTVGGTTYQDESVRLALARYLRRGSRLDFGVEHNRRVSILDPYDETYFHISVGHNFRH